MKSLAARYGVRGMAEHRAHPFARQACSLCQQSAQANILGQAKAREGRLSIYGTARELLEFMRDRKKLWLLPIVTVLVLLGGLLVLAEGSALAPFIYSIF